MSSVHHQAHLRVRQHELLEDQDGGRYFGELPGYPIGATFPSRAAASAVEVHRPPMSGISGTGAEGADSIVVSGGYGTTKTSATS